MKDTSSLESDIEPLQKNLNAKNNYNNFNSSGKDNEKDKSEKETRIPSSRSHRNEPVTHDSEESMEDDDEAEDDTSVVSNSLSFLV